MKHAAFFATVLTLCFSPAFPQLVENQIQKKLDPCRGDMWKLVQNKSIPTGHAKLRFKIEKGYESGTYDAIVVCGDLVVHGFGSQKMTINKWKASYAEFGIAVPRAGLESESEQKKNSTCSFELRQKATAIVQHKILLECEIRVASVLSRIVPHCSETAKKSKEMLQYINVKKSQGNVHIYFRSSPNNVVKIKHYCENNPLARFGGAVDKEGVLISLNTFGTHERIYAVSFYPDCEHFNATIRKLFMNTEDHACHLSIYAMCQEGTTLVKSMDVDLDKKAMICHPPKSSYTKTIERAKLKFRIESDAIVFLLLFMLFNIILYLLLIPCLVTICVRGLLKAGKRLQLGKRRRRDHKNKKKPKKPPGAGSPYRPTDRLMEDMEYDDGDVYIAHKSAKHKGAKVEPSKLDEPIKGHRKRMKLTEVHPKETELTFAPFDDSLHYDSFDEEPLPKPTSDVAIDMEPRSNNLIDFQDRAARAYDPASLNYASMPKSAQDISNTTPSGGEVDCEVNARKFSWQSPKDSPGKAREHLKRSDTEGKERYDHRYSSVKSGLDFIRKDSAEGFIELKSKPSPMEEPQQDEQKKRSHRKSDHGVKKSNSAVGDSTRRPSWDLEKVEETARQKRDGRKDSRKHRHEKATEDDQIKKTHRKSDHGVKKSDSAGDGPRKLGLDEEGTELQKRHGRKDSSARKHSHETTTDDKAKKSHRKSDHGVKESDGEGDVPHRRKKSSLKEKEADQVRKDSSGKRHRHEKGKTEEGDVKTGREKDHEGDERRHKHERKDSKAHRESKSKAHSSPDTPRSPKETPKSNSFVSKFIQSMRSPSDANKKKERSGKDEVASKSKLKDGQQLEKQESSSNVKKSRSRDASQFHKKRESSEVPKSKSKSKLKDATTPKQSDSQESSPDVKDKDVKRSRSRDGPDEVLSKSDSKLKDESRLHKDSLSERELSSTDKKRQASQEHERSRRKDSSEKRHRHEKEKEDDVKTEKDRKKSKSLTERRRSTKEFKSAPSDLKVVELKQLTTDEAESALQYDSFGEEPLPQPLSVHDVIINVEAPTVDFEAADTYAESSVVMERRRVHKKSDRGKLAESRTQWAKEDEYAYRIIKKRRSRPSSEDGLERQKETSKRKHRHKGSREDEESRHKKGDGSEESGLDQKERHRKSSSRKQKGEELSADDPAKESRDKIEAESQKEKSHKKSNQTPKTLDSSSKDISAEMLSPSTAERDSAADAPEGTKSEDLSPKEQKTSMSPGDKRRSRDKSKSTDKDHSDVKRSHSTQDASQSPKKTPSREEIQKPKSFFARLIGSGSQKDSPGKKKSDKHVAGDKDSHKLSSESPGVKKSQDASDSSETRKTDKPRKSKTQEESSPAIKSLPSLAREEDSPARTPTEDKSKDSKRKKSDLKKSGSEGDAAHHSTLKEEKKGDGSSRKHKHEDGGDQDHKKHRKPKDEEHDVEDGHIDPVRRKKGDGDHTKDGSQKRVSKNRDEGPHDLDLTQKSPSMQKSLSPAVQDSFSELVSTSRGATASPDISSDNKQSWKAPSDEDVSIAKFGMEHERKEGRRDSLTKKREHKETSKTGVKDDVSWKQSDSDSDVAGHRIRKASLSKEHEREKASKVHKDEERKASFVYSLKDSDSDNGSVAKPLPSTREKEKRKSEDYPLESVGVYSDVYYADLEANTSTLPERVLKRLDSEAYYSTLKVRIPQQSKHALRRLGNEGSAEVKSPRQSGIDGESSPAYQIRSVREHPVQKTPSRSARDQTDDATPSEALIKSHEDVNSSRKQKSTPTIKDKQEYVTQSPTDKRSPSQDALKKQSDHSPVVVKDKKIPPRPDSGPGDTTSHSKQKIKSSNDQLPPRSPKKYSHEGANNATVSQKSSHDHKSPKIDERSSSVKKSRGEDASRVHGPEDKKSIRPAEPTAEDDSSQFSHARQGPSKSSKTSREGADKLPAKSPQVSPSQLDARKQKSTPYIEDKKVSTKQSTSIGVKISHSRYASKSSRDGASRSPSRAPTEAGKDSGLDVDHKQKPSQKSASHEDADQTADSPSKQKSVKDKPVQSTDDKQSSGVKKSRSRDKAKSHSSAVKDDEKAPSTLAEQDKDPSTDPRKSPLGESGGKRGQDKQESLGKDVVKSSRSRDSPKQKTPEDSLGKKKSAAEDKDSVVKRSDSSKQKTPEDSQSKKKSADKDSVRDSQKQKTPEDKKKSNSKDKDSHKKKSPSISLTADETQASPSSPDKSPKKKSFFSRLLQSKSPSSDKQESVDTDGTSSKQKKKKDADKVSSGKQKKKQSSEKDSPGKRKLSSVSPADILTEASSLQKSLSSKKKLKSDEAGKDSPTKQKLSGVTSDKVKKSHSSPDASHSPPQSSPDAKLKIKVQTDEPSAGKKQGSDDMKASKSFSSLKKRLDSAYTQRPGTVSPSKILNWRANVEMSSTPPDQSISSTSQTIPFNEDDAKLRTSESVVDRDIQEFISPNVSRGDFLLDKPDPTTPHTSGSELMQIPAESPVKQSSSLSASSDEDKFKDGISPAPPQSSPALPYPPLEPSLVTVPDQEQSSPRHRHSEDPQARSRLSSGRTHDVFETPRLSSDEEELVTLGSEMQKLAESRPEAISEHQSSSTTSSSATKDKEVLRHSSKGKESSTAILHMRATTAESASQQESMSQQESGRRRSSTVTPTREGQVGDPVAGVSYSSSSPSLKESASRTTSKSYEDLTHQQQSQHRRTSTAGKKEHARPARFSGSRSYYPARRHATMQPRKLTETHDRSQGASLTTYRHLSMQQLPDPSSSDSPQDADPIDVPHSWQPIGTHWSVQGHKPATPPNYDSSALEWQESDHAFGEPATAELVSISTSTSSPKLKPYWQMPRPIPLAPPPPQQAPLIASPSTSRAHRIARRPLEGLEGEYFYDLDDEYYIL